MNERTLVLYAKLFMWDGIGYMISGLILGLVEHLKQLHVMPMFHIIQDDLFVQYDILTVK